ncbi:MAG: hypothetical protein ABIP80_01730 [Ferruginibacter sp.]
MRMAPCNSLAALDSRGVIWGARPRFGVRTAALIALTLVGLLAAGCVGTADPVPWIGELARMDGPTAQPTLAAPPQWRTGDWWQIEVTTPWEERVVATRVVAGALADQAIVGFPPSEWHQADALLTLHLPGFGEVGRANLSFAIHDKPFAPIRFPVVVGDTWETTFEGFPLDATVEAVQGLTAQVRYRGAFPGNGTYDAEIGEMRSLAMDGYATMTVLEWGHGYDGAVVWPRGQDFLWPNFGKGRYIGVFNETRQPAAPIETAVVEDRFDRLSYNFAIGSTGWPASAPGYYRERLTAPDGTVHEYVVDPTDGVWFGFPTGGQNDPGGTWTLEHYALGIGIAGTEAIGYQAFEVDLGDGTVTRVVPPLSP